MTDTLAVAYDGSTPGRTPTMTGTHQPHTDPPEQRTARGTSNDAPPRPVSLTGPAARLIHEWLAEATRAYHHGNYDRAQAASKIANTYAHIANTAAELGAEDPDPELARLRAELAEVLGHTPDHFGSDAELVTALRFRLVTSSLDLDGLHRETAVHALQQRMRLSRDAAQSLVDVVLGALHQSSTEEPAAEESVEEPVEEEPQETPEDAPDELTEDRPDPQRNTEPSPPSAE